jgi:hypothetical protein
MRFQHDGELNLITLFTSIVWLNAADFVSASDVIWVKFLKLTQGKSYEILLWYNI